MNRRELLRVGLVGAGGLVVGGIIVALRPRKRLRYSVEQGDPGEERAQACENERVRIEWADGQIDEG